MTGRWRDAARVGAVLLEPAPLVLAGATVAHVARRNVVDISVFASTLGLIVADRALDRSPSWPTARRRTPLNGPVVPVLVAVFALTVGSRPKIGRA